MTNVRQRSLFAEKFAAELSSKPLVWECVFPNPKFLDKSEKEVCDFMLILKSKTILVQMKAQEDPESRSREKLESWVVKKTKEALKQLQGAINTVSSRDFWCIHPRRGKVEFKANSLNIVHGIVLVESTFDPKTQIQLPRDLSTSFRGIPVSYFSLNDFLNIIKELRAFPEITAYLRWRHHLSEDTRRTCGGERTFFEYYMLTEGAQDQIKSYEVMQAEVAENPNLVKICLNNLHSYTTATSLIEDVTNQLSERSGTYLKNLPSEIAALYEPANSRKGYLRMQEEICDLFLPERKYLGAQFQKLIGAVQYSHQEQDFRYNAAFFDSKPDFLYIFASSKGMERTTVLMRGFSLLKGGLSFYNKLNGLAIIDRNGESYESILIRDFSATVEDQELGETLFANVRVDTVQATLTQFKTK